jgi:hypothetical protein
MKTLLQLIAWLAGCIVFFLIVLPWGMVSRLFSDPLHLRRRSVASYLRLPDGGAGRVNRSSQGELN